MASMLLQSQQQQSQPKTIAPMRVTKTEDSGVSHDALGMSSAEFDLFVKELRSAASPACNYSGEKKVPRPSSTAVPPKPVSLPAGPSSSASSPARSSSRASSAASSPMTSPCRKIRRPMPQKPTTAQRTRSTSAGEIALRIAEKRERGMKEAEKAKRKRNEEKPLSNENKVEDGSKSPDDTERNMLLSMLHSELMQFRAEEVEGEKEQVSGKSSTATGPGCNNSSNKQSSKLTNNDITELLDFMRRSRRKASSLRSERDGLVDIVNALTMSGSDASTDAIAHAAAAANATTDSERDGGNECKDKTLPLHLVQMMETIPWDQRARKHTSYTEEVYEWQYYTNKNEWTKQIGSFPPCFLKSLPVSKPVVKSLPTLEESKEGCAQAGSLPIRHESLSQPANLSTRLSPGGAVLTDLKGTALLNLEEGYPLPTEGTWNWVGGWRVDTDMGGIACDSEGWSYAADSSHLLNRSRSNCQDRPGVGQDEVVRRYRFRRWTRLRVLVSYPGISLKTKEYLSLAAHNASLMVSISKLSNQLLEAESKMAEMEEKVAANRELHDQLECLLDIVKEKDEKLQNMEVSLIRARNVVSEKNSRLQSMEEALVRASHGEKGVIFKMMRDKSHNVRKMLAAAPPSPPPPPPPPVTSDDSDTSSTSSSDTMLICPDAASSPRAVVDANIVPVFDWKNVFGRALIKQVSWQKGSRDADNQGRDDSDGDEDRNGVSSSENSSVSSNEPEGGEQTLEPSENRSSSRPKVHGYENSSQDLSIASSRPPLVSAESESSFEYVPNSRRLSARESFADVIASHNGVIQPESLKAELKIWKELEPDFEL